MGGYWNTATDEQNPYPTWVEQADPVYYMGPPGSNVIRWDVEVSSDGKTRYNKPFWEMTDPQTGEVTTGYGTTQVTEASDSGSGFGGFLNRATEAVSRGVGVINDNVGGAISDVVMPYILPAVVGTGIAVGTGQVAGLAGLGATAAGAVGGAAAGAIPSIAQGSPIPLVTGAALGGIGGQLSGMMGGPSKLGEMGMDLALDTGMGASGASASGMGAAGGGLDTLGMTGIASGAEAGSSGLFYGAPEAEGLLSGSAIGTSSAGDYGVLTDDMLASYDAEDAADALKGITAGDGVAPYAEDVLGETIDTAGLSKNLLKSILKSGLQGLGGSGGAGKPQSYGVSNFTPQTAQTWNYNPTNFATPAASVAQAGSGSQLPAYQQYAGLGVLSRDKEKLELPYLRNYLKGDYRGISNFIA